MMVAGLQKNSLVDFPGKISAVVFTQGCNMKCGYCHNSRLISGREKADFINEEEALSFLQKRKGLLDGVVITGGEPTLQVDLKDFIKNVAHMGYSIKLDTNGTNPEVLDDLIACGMLDYVAMDIKAPLAKYNAICCSSIDVDKIKQSVEILMENRVEYEFRTTFAPELNLKDLLEIAGFIKGAQKYVIQQYHEVDSRTGAPTGRKDNRSIKEVLKDLQSSVKSFQIRGEFAFS